MGISCIKKREVHEKGDALIKKTGYTAQELYWIHRAFIDNTILRVGEYWINGQARIKYDIYKGLCEVVKFLCKLDKIDYNNYSKVFEYDKLLDVVSKGNVADDWLNKLNIIERQKLYKYYNFEYARVKNEDRLFSNGLKRGDNVRVKYDDNEYFNATIVMICSSGDVIITRDEEILKLDSDLCTIITKQK
jgi:hypothetical protein